jgi:hypothetical protein
MLLKLPCAKHPRTNAFHTHVASHMQANDKSVKGRSWSTPWRSDQDCQVVPTSIPCWASQGCLQMLTCVTPPTYRWAEHDIRKCWAGKLTCLQELLERLITVEKDRVVIASQSTAALDIISALCVRRGYRTARIDGSTDTAKRQDIVSAFNSGSIAEVHNSDLLFDAASILVIAHRCCPGASCPAQPNFLHYVISWSSHAF